MPNFYSIYVPTPSARNYEIGKNKDVWGFSKKRGADDPIKKGDIIIFMFSISLSTNPQTGQANARQFFQGTVEEIRICEATTDLYFDDQLEIWPIKDTTTNDVDNYPYRFKIKLLASKSNYIVNDYTTPSAIQEAMRVCCCRQG